MFAAAMGRRRGIVRVLQKRRSRQRATKFGLGPGYTLFVVFLRPRNFYNI